MYMSLFWNKAKICEVDIYANNIPNTDQWTIELSVYFDVKNLLKLHDSAYTHDEQFIEDFTTIQKWRLNFMENMDKDFPKSEVYFFGKDYDTMTSDEFKLIKVLRKRLYEIAEKYNLTYNED